jgi:hypothetical protein
MVKTVILLLQTGIDITVVRVVSIRVVVVVVVITTTNRTRN